MPVVAKPLFVLASGSGGSLKPAQCLQPHPFVFRTVAAICGPDFVIMGGDTRMSAGSTAVIDRDCKKLHKLSESVCLGVAGFHGDIIQLCKVLRARMKMYKYSFREDMHVDTIASMLSRTLYYKRFFPYYTANILGGIDINGKGALYTYDPVGTIEKIEYSVQGAAMQFIEPFLDNQIGWITRDPSTREPLTKEKAVALLRDAFRAGSEREASTGDSLFVITLQNGQDAVEEIVPLRGD